MKRVVDILLYSNLIIAWCGVAIFETGLLLLGAELQWDITAWFVFFSTLFTYLFIRIVARNRISSYQPERRWDFFLQHFSVLKWATIFTGLCSLGLFIFLPRPVQLAMLVPGAVSVLYGLPLGAFRLRDMGIMKIFLIGFVWAFNGSALPAIASGADPWHTDVLLLFAAQFLFIFAITLPFDVKDIEIDALNQVKSIPAYLGKENTFTLSFICLFASAAIHSWMQRTYAEADLSVAMGVSILITGMVIYATRSSTRNADYFGWIDGMIILQFLICYGTYVFVY
ncbi:MAG: UbiA family prenyltransferase [Chitinophagales bacterium]